MKAKELIITPRTKILELIETYPELEDILVSKIPVFSKLKNPLLRRTVANVSTLQQAAHIGNININELINILRQTIGQEETIEMNNEQSYNFSKPEWFDESKVVLQLDVREMLERGEHPVNQVIADLKILYEGKIYLMIASFLPAPLIDKATGLGFAHWVIEKDKNLVYIYFSK
jgi:hypothetical protein